MPHQFIRACTAFIVTWLVLFSAHTAAASWQPSLRTDAALADRQSTVIAKAAGCANTYVVRKGDTLAVIARRCGVSVTTLQRLNGLRSDAIRVGQVLSIRSSVSTLTPKAPVAAPTPRIDSPPSPW